MQLHGFVMSAELVEEPPESGTIELVLRVQGVGPGQPRRLVVPFAMLLADESLSPEGVRGRPFEAEAVEERPGRWVVAMLAVGDRRVLREEGPSAT
ncbi:MAG TPA: hypothetical protein VG406_23640 [Isosphaeraceae bacterium]|jgi:hypothetical protein|nr:hypothetical protein [Isosphaeraceae bacterium]